MTTFVWEVGCWVWWDPEFHAGAHMAGQQKQKKVKTPQQKAAAKARRARRRSAKKAAVANEKKPGFVGPQRGSKKQVASSRASSAMASAWCKLLANPFSEKLAHIPDPSTADSGLAKSRKNFVLTCVGTDNPSSTTHTFGILVTPDPNVCYVQLQEITSAGNMSDLNITGTNFISSSAVPNASALVGGVSGMIRCTAIGVTIEYDGTELQRAGRYVVGMLNNQEQTGTTVVTGTYGSLLSACSDTATATIASGVIEDSLIKKYVGRIGGSGKLNARWVPLRAPAYMIHAYNSNNGAVPGAFPTYSTSGGAAIPIGDSYYTQAPNSVGIQNGVGVLCILIDGDAIPTAGHNSNKYNVSIEWSWEIVPANLQATTYSMEPSVVNFTEYATCLNKMSLMTVAGQSFQ